MEIKIEPNRLASLSKRMMEHQNRTKNLQNSLERESGKMTSLLWQSEFPPPFTGQITGQNDMINQTSQRIVNTLEYQAAWLSYFAHKASGADGAPFSLKQAEAVLAKYDDRFRKPEKEKGLDKEKLAKDAAGELTGAYDLERALTGIDPSNGERLSGKEQLFSSGMFILGVTPVGKGFKAYKLVRTTEKMASVAKEGTRVKKIVSATHSSKNVVKQGDRSLLAPGGGLASHEVRGGHLIERHVGKTNEELLERLRSNPRITGSSTFNDRGVAEKVASKVLNDPKNSEKIKKWLSDPNSRPNLPLKYQGDGGILGRSVSRDSDIINDVTNAKIILKKDKNGSFILTGYPVK